MAGGARRALLFLLVAVPLTLLAALGLAQLQWMRWTVPSGLFFGAVALALLLLTASELWRPTVERKGFLPITTTRGDRFFIALLIAGLVHLLNLGLLPDQLWLAWVCSGLGLVVVMRWG